MGNRILVIDDSPMTVALIGGALSQAGFQVESAQDLASLDERLAGPPFDAVLVDVNMPEMYGDDVVEFLRVQRKITAKLALYSDISEAELAQKAKNVGADGYITKSAGLEAAVDLARTLIGSAVALPPRRVLVVEAARSLAERMGPSILGEGGELQMAATVPEATRALLKKKTRPDLVVIDAATPGVDPVELCRTVKSNAVFHGIRVAVVMAGNHAVDDAARTAGADLVLPNDEQLEHRLASLLQESR